MPDSKWHCHLQVACLRQGRSHTIHWYHSINIHVIMSIIVHAPALRLGVQQTSVDPRPPDFTLLSYLVHIACHSSGQDLLSHHDYANCNPYMHMFPRSHSPADHDYLMTTRYLLRMHLAIHCSANVLKAILIALSNFRQHIFRDANSSDQRSDHLSLWLLDVLNLSQWYVHISQASLRSIMITWCYAAYSLCLFCFSISSCPSVTFRTSPWPVQLQAIAFS